MIDNISISIAGDWAKLLEHPKLSFSDHVERENGNIKYSYANFQNLRFRIVYGTNARLEIKNSLHKFWRGTNADNFTFPDLLATINYLEKEFGFSANDAMVKSFEFGVVFNIPEPFSQKIKGMLLSKYRKIKTTQFDSMRGGRNGSRNSWGVECDFSEFKVKAYDKGKEYPLHKGKLRFEVKVKKMRWINNIDILTIHNLSDLTAKSNLVSLGQVLLNTYDSILKIEDIPKEALKQLNIKDRDLLLNGQLEGYWENQRQFNRNTAKSRLKRFEELQNQCKGDSIHDTIRELIAQRWSSLVNSQKSAFSPKFTTFEKDVISIAPHPNSPLVNMVNLSEPVSLTDEQKELFVKRKCVICSTNISHKRSHAKTCSKRCRNALSNPKHNLSRLVISDKKILTLFDSSPFFEHSILKAKITLAHKKSGKRIKLKTAKKVHKKMAQ